MKQAVHHHRQPRGVALLTVMLILLIVLGAVVAMGTIHVQNLGMLATDVLARQAFYAAEAGLQDALARLKQAGTLPGTFTASLPNVSTSSYTVSSVSNLGGSAPLVAPDGTSVPPGAIYLRSTGTVGTATARTVSAVAVGGNGGPFSMAVYSNGNMALAGGATIDAWNSKKGPYAPPKEPQVNAPVGTSNGTISIKGDKTSVDGNIFLGTGATVNGSGYTGTVIPNSSAPPQPAVTPPALAGTPVSVSVPPSLPGDTLDPGLYQDLDVRSGGTVTFKAGTYYFKGSVSFTGNSVLVVSGGPAIVYVDGSWDSTGGSLVNQTGLASNFILLGTTADSAIRVAGGSSACGAIYTPLSAVTLTGQGSWYGALVAASVDATGGTEIHYDLSLRDVGLDGTSSGGTVTWKLRGFHRL